MSALVTGSYKFNIVKVSLSILALNHKLREILKIIELIYLNQIRNGYEYFNLFIEYDFRFTEKIDVWYVLNHLRVLPFVD